MLTTITGIAAISAPLLVTALVFVRRNLPLVLCFLVLSAASVGYLYVEGVVDDIGAIVLENAGWAEPPPRPMLPALSV